MVGAEDPRPVRDHSGHQPRRLRGLPGDVEVERTHVAALDGVGMVRAEDPSLVNRQLLHQPRRSRRIQIALGLPHPGVTKSQFLMGRRDLSGPLRTGFRESATG
ncbi:hypothetical protein SAMN02787144_1006109 [Streptomyces atratus]|uniref:Uncharacterized protein n=1 Tax=Streptomyces atratus TaxID=1893 RepID=A0A1K1ZUQ7_STRAR|nr:hypothetical protein SAMN02787144_1006109 [Streptomyces atratus]